MCCKHIGQHTNEMRQACDRNKCTRTIRSIAILAVLQILILGLSANIRCDDVPYNTSAYLVRHVVSAFFIHYPLQRSLRTISLSLPLLRHPEAHMLQFLMGAYQLDSLVAKMILALLWLTVQNGHVLVYASEIVFFFFDCSNSREQVICWLMWDTVHAQHSTTLTSYLLTGVRIVYFVNYT